MQSRPGSRKAWDAQRIVGEVEALPEEETPPPGQQYATKSLTPNPFDVTISVRLSTPLLVRNSHSVIRTLVTLSPRERSRS